MNEELMKRVADESQKLGRITTLTRKIKEYENKLESLNNDSITSVRFCYYQKGDYRTEFESNKDNRSFKLLLEIAKTECEERIAECTNELIKLLNNEQDEKIQ